MANPTQQVPTEAIPFTEEKVYWPGLAGTADVTYTGEMIGMRFDTGYAQHFDDSVPMLFLGSKEQITSRWQSDTPTADFKFLVRKPRYLSLPLNTGVTATATIPGSIGLPAYASDSGHVQLSTSGLTNNNLAGMVVDISRSYSAGDTGGLRSLTTASTTASVVVKPPEFGCLMGLVVQGFVGQDITSGASTAGGAAPGLTITAGRGGKQSVTSATAAGGAGASVTIAAGAGGNADGTTSTGNGGAGGSLVLNAGAGGTTVGGSAGAAGNVKIANNVAIPAGGSAAAFVQIGSTAGFGIYFGSGAPSSLTAAAGSVYFRSDGSSSATRMYINTTGSTTWTTVTTAA